MVGNDQYTSLLIHAEQASGTAGTSILDSSSFNHTITANDNAEVTTALSYFGNGCLSFDGSSDYLSVPSNDCFNFGTNDFTIDFWFNDNGTSTNYPNMIGNQGGWTTGSFSIRYNCSTYAGQVTVHLNGDGDPLLTSTTTYSSNTWNHVAIVKCSGIMYLFVNGILKDNASSVIPVNLSYSNTVKIGGGNWDGANSYYKGYLDEIRVSSGIARWTENFIPPTSQYTTENNGNINVYTQGTDEYFDIDVQWLNYESGNMPLYVHNNEFYFDLSTETSGNLGLYTIATITNSGDVDLYTNSHITESGDINFYARGINEASGEFPIYSEGHIAQSGDMYLYGKSAYTDDGGIYLYTKGHVDLPLYVLCSNGHTYGNPTGSIGLYVCNTQTSGSEVLENQTISIYCSGQSAQETNISVPIYVQVDVGTSSGSIPICVNTTIPTNITGRLGIYTNCTENTGVMGGAYESINLYTCAYYGTTQISQPTFWTNVSGSIPLYVERPIGADLPLFIKCGPFDASGDIGLYSAAVYLASGDLGIYANSDDFKESGDLNIYVNALTYGNLNLYTTGKVDISGDLGIYADGVTGSENSSIYIYCNGLSSGSGNLWIYSHGF